ncbi:MAG TPA: signal peptidase I [Clostridia bacterium]|nr:signal peptidase I [Clostridia bacterium]
MRSETDHTSERKRIATAADAFSAFVTILFLILVLFLLYSLVADRDDNGSIRIGPYAYMTVLSSSMEPAISAGDVVVTKACDPNAVSVGDIITFRPYAGTGVLLTHRVVEITDEGLLTRGDANNMNDENPILPQASISRVVLVIPFIGFLLSGPAGLFTISGIFLTYILVEAAVKAFKKKRRARKSVCAPL